MKTKNYLTFIGLLVLLNISAQSKLNNYKYVIVPDRFDFQKQSDQYQLNSLTKFLLEKENLQVFMGDEPFPTDLSENRCLGLYVNVVRDNKLFKTLLKLQFKDCYNNLILESGEGMSREKEYLKAYHEALRRAYATIQGFNYKYDGNRNPDSKKTNRASKIESNNQQINLKLEESILVEEPEFEKKDSLAFKNIYKEQSKSFKVVEYFLKAVPTSTGFDVVNSTDGKKQFDLIPTGKKEVFFVNSEHAIVYKNSVGIWKKETLKSGQIIVVTLDIRF